MKKRYAYVLPAVLLIVAAALWFVASPPRAPLLSLTALDGSAIALGWPAKKMVLLNFWATDCPGCVEEMPHLAAFYRQHQSHLAIIAIAMPHDPPNQVSSFSKAHQLPFPVALDVDGTAVKSMQVAVTPTSFLIDQKGRVVRQFIGEIDFKRLETLVLDLEKGT